MTKQVFENPVPVSELKGLLEFGLYKVEVSLRPGNPFHEAVMHVGFLDDKGRAAGYTEIWNNSYDEAASKLDKAAIKSIELLSVVNK